MSKKIALDTNIAIDVINGKQETILKLESFDRIYLPIVVCGELLYGAKNSSKSVQNLRKFKKFINQCKILNTDFRIAELYSNIRYELKLNGTPIPENDIWIASICQYNQITLATKDKHLGYIRGFDLLPFI